MAGTWPDFFPDVCPPADATDACGVFYRLVQNPPCKGDFVSKRELEGKFPHQDYSKECAFCGLSMLKTEEDANNYKKQYGRFDKFRDSVVARGELKAHFGKIKATPHSKGMSHHTWWLPLEVPIEELIECFKVIVVS